MHTLAHTQQLQRGWLCLQAGGALKDTAAAADDHAPHATTSFIEEGAYVVLLHYLKTQQEWLKKKIQYCKAGCKSDKTLFSFYQPGDKVQGHEGSGTYSGLKFK